MPSSGEDDSADDDDTGSPADESMETDKAAEESEDTQTPEETTPEDETPEDDTPRDNRPRDDTHRDNRPRDDTPRDNRPRENIPEEDIFGEDTRRHHSQREHGTREDRAGDATSEDRTDSEEMLPEGSRDRVPARGRETADSPQERRRGAVDSERQGRPVSTREEWRSEPRRRAPAPEETADDNPGEFKLFVYDVVSSVLAVAVIGAYLFAVSGVWPPLVAVESGSMEPNMQVNDLVFVMEEERFPGPGAHPAGIVTARAGEETGYQQFNGYGDVIVYHPNGNEQTTPIIHRAMFWVEEGDNWCRQADPAYVGGIDPGSEQCVADHSGFITKGDNNARYDQAQQLSGPVKPEWVVGTAQLRVPGLGWIRLHSAG